MKTETVDVLIIGSGHAGGMAAKILTERGIRCLMLNAGPMIDVARYAKHRSSYELPFRGFKPPGKLEHVFQASAFNTSVWVDETEVPYTFNPAHPYNWVRVRLFGGRSLFWSRQSFRLSDYEFKGRSHDGFGEDWPIDHAELSPFYSRVEEIFRVVGALDGPPQMPDGNFILDEAPWSESMQRFIAAGKPFGVVVCKQRRADGQDGLASSINGLAHVVTFNYRGNPLVQQAREMIARGEAGNLCFIHGCYLQDYLTSPDAYTWRVDPGRSGASNVLGDIGSHWCDLAEHVSGHRIVAVLAELTTVVPTRYTTGATTEALSKQKGGERTPVAMQLEDLASVLVRFENGVRGSFSVGQTLPGHKNDLRLELNGSQCSLGWKQEQQNELWIGRQDQANSILMKDPGLVSGDALRYTRLPGGHQEAWADAFFNIVRDAYDWIRAGAAPGANSAALPTFEDGYRSNCVIDAMLRSHAAGGVWQGVEYEHA